MDAPEIARHLGITASSVRVHIHHALAMLERAVGDELPFNGESNDASNVDAEEKR